MQFPVNLLAHEGVEYNRRHAREDEVQQNHDDVHVRRPEPADSLAVLDCAVASSVVQDLHQEHKHDETHEDDRQDRRPEQLVIEICAVLHT